MGQKKVTEQIILRKNSLEPAKLRIIGSISSQKLMIPRESKKGENTENINCFKNVELRKEL